MGFAKLSSWDGGGDIFQCRISNSAVKILTDLATVRPKEAFWEDAEKDVWEQETHRRQSKQPRASTVNSGGLSRGRRGVDATVAIRL